MWTQLFLSLFFIDLIESNRIDFESPLIIQRFTNESSDQRYCGKTGRLLRLNDNLPISCTKNVDCVAPAVCEPTTRFCCLLVHNRSPLNLLGCPKGFQPLKTSGNRPLICQPHSPDTQKSHQCPGDSICIEDKKEGKWKCCGRDPAEGCSPGNRALKLTDGSTQLCLPEARLGPNRCPENTTCQWSFLIDKYQCCESDNGCSRGEIPIKENGKPKLCQTNTDCPSTAKCIFNVWTSSFQCCRKEEITFSKQLAIRQVEYTCPFRFMGPEIQLNRERRCNIYGEWSQCSVGFTCVPSVEDSQVLLCCGPAESHDSPLYRCANLGSTPETTPQGNNVFCDLINQQNQCARGSICQNALNSFGMMICCRNVPSNSPICPEGRAAQAADAGYVPCDTSLPSQCLSNYICLPSMNLPQIALCCSRLTSQSLICPNQQVLYRENGRPRICSLNQINPCPSGYICQPSVGSPTIAVCCSIPSTTICPSGYSVQPDLNGNPIYCSEVNQNICPGGSLCLESPNQPERHVCCSSRTAPRVCPEGMDALLKPGTNQLERCNTPGTPCSQPAYICRYSEILASYACCGRAPQIARCADGRETYVQDFGRTYTCQPTLLNQCPNGYDCSLSSLNSIFVCCKTEILPPTLPPIYPTTYFPPAEPTDYPTFRPPASELTCPTGWSAYEDTLGAHHFCRSALDSSCPQGFSCAQSSVNGIFLCCRLAYNLHCGNPQATPLLQNNAPRLCAAKYINSCPQGFTCQESSVSHVYICCSLTTPFIINGQVPRILQGPTINGQTPWTLNNQGIPYLLPSTSSILCNDGEVPAYVGGKLIQCNYLGQADICPPTYYCSLSNQAGINVCCHFLLRSRSPLHQLSVSKPVSQNVCGKSAIAYTNNKLQPLECSEDHDLCPKGFECQPSMANHLMYCCQEARCRPKDRQMIRKTCLEDKDCDEDNERCEHSYNIQFIRLCCPIDEPTPSQPVITSGTKTLPSLLAGEQRTLCVGRRTFLVSGNAMHCTTDDACPEEFVCSSLTTNGDAICCQRPEAIQMICPENRNPFRHVSSDQLAYCDPYDAEACPSSYICKWSTQINRYLCCSPIAFCKEGRIPLIDEKTQQAKRCYERSSASGISNQCSDGYTCSESTVPKFRVCCSVVGSAFVVKSAVTEIERDLGNNKMWTILEG